MLSILVAYATGEGQTAAVADRVGAVVEARGHAVDVVDIGRESALAVDDYDAVIVGSSIHYGRHGKRVRRFVRDNREALTARPTAFFQLSLASAADTEEGVEEAAGYVEAFLEATDWHPDRIAQFGGALRYSKYGFLKRLMMRRIVGDDFPDVDPHGDTEFTDWAEVEAFANDVAAFAEGRVGVVPRPSTDDGP
ncbi:flavodoxin domain-containing protein [Halobaculum marinum]|uniref:Flavodoxin domain-containing protein n=1 Tax=Halobaculum marinum TaxID=3031996 RepID=A0ABD5WWT5_9EURY|nr:flavodoxin domain-containing protein [Halobaculum sp. DT55]